MTVPEISPGELIDRYDGLFLDAYGVLVDGSGPLPGAAEFVAALARRSRPFVILSNDASRLPETAAARYRGFGIPIDADHVVTSGSLLGPHFERAGLRGKACIVLGPEDSKTMVTRAGGDVVDASDDTAQVIVVCDDAGYPFLPTIEAAISGAIRRLDRGDAVQLVLPNPDLTYPKAPGEIGLTSGSVALVFEAALQLRFGETAPKFVGLGKPHRPIFEAAAKKLGLGPDASLAMVGDQLGTDIAGARRFGIDAVLVATGLGRPDPTSKWAPTWVMAGLVDSAEGGPPARP